MLSFRQKILFSYIIIFFTFTILMFPVVHGWVHHIIVKAMEDRSHEIIANIKDAPNNEALIRRLKDQKGLIFFRVGVITNEHKVLYDSHVKRLLGPKFSQDYILEHPEITEAFLHGAGYHEEYSELLEQSFSYYAMSFDFHGQKYVLRTAFPLRYVNELTKDFELGFIVFSILILSMFSLMTWFFINYLTSPIHNIIKAIKPYQAGNQHTLPAIDVSRLSPKDDLTKLAMTLNSLSSKIQHHIDTITEQRNEKEAILESLVEGVIAVDKEFNIAYINNTANRFINHEQHPLTEQPFSILNQDLCLALLQRCQLENAALTDKLQLTVEGKKSYFDIVAAPKKDNGGAILVLQDKTADFKMTQMRRDFIANASHELKTPITVIRGFAEVLHNNPGLPESTQEEITTKIVNSCNRMTGLIKDLLTLADVENIPFSRLSECPLFSLTNRCRLMVKEAHPSATIEIYEEHKDISIIASEELLELALMNLMENGAKYSTPPAHITVSIKESDDNVTIQVADKGIGIPLGDQDHIFDRFYTVDKAHSKKMGGSGLGLSIVKTIIEKHHGTIDLVSALGKGTTFTIILPKIKVPLNEDFA